MPSPHAGTTGYVAQPFHPVRTAFSQLVGNAPGGGALAVRWRGETVVNLCTGTLDRAGQRPWTPDSLALSFSTTKGAAGAVVHRLADRGELDYDEPVATYWPEFGAGGKGRVTVRHLMTHRAGLSSVQAVARRAEDLLDHLAMEDRLAARTVAAPTARSAYHAITYGWLISGLVRRLTGRGLHDNIQTEIAGTLGTDGLHIGAPPAIRSRVAEPVGSALRQLGTAARVLGPLWTRIGLTRAGYEALHISGFHRLFEGPEPPIWSTEMPAVNGMFSAEGLARPVRRAGRRRRGTRRPPAALAPCGARTGPGPGAFKRRRPGPADALAAGLPPGLRCRSGRRPGPSVITATGAQAVGPIRRSGSRSASSPTASAP